MELEAKPDRQSRIIAAYAGCLHRYSRNPQYMADMAILVGWAVLSASGWAAFIAAVGVLTLAVAPFAEEPWLEENYGERFRVYQSCVRRYI